MALSGTNVVFPMAASAAAMPEFWLDHHGEKGWDESNPVGIGVDQAIDNGDIIAGWRGSFSQYTWCILDAGYNTGEANRIPSGSIITAVRAEVQLADANFSAVDDLQVDVGLAPRDGKWDALSGLEFTSLSRAVDDPGIGKTGRPRPLVVGRLASNPKRIENTQDTGTDWKFLSLWRHSIDGVDKGYADGMGDTFEVDSSADGAIIASLGMRMRRFPGVGFWGIGKYRFEVWSVSGDDVPDQLLTWTDESNLTGISTATFGVTVTRNLAAGDGGGGVFTVSAGVRYHVRVDTSNTSLPRASDADKYVQLGMKDEELVSFGFRGCTASGTSFIRGWRHWLSYSSYGARGALPSMYYRDSNQDSQIDIATPGGYIASGLSGATLSGYLNFEWGSWVGLSGVNEGVLVSAVQAWIDDPAYTTSGPGAVMNLQTAGWDSGSNSAAVGISGMRLLISWGVAAIEDLPNCDWFTARSAQDWKTDQSGPDWKTDQSGPDWFVKKECV